MTEFKQPQPIDIDVTIINGAIMYSMLDIGALMKLRKFIDALIKWKAAGNPCHIGTIEFLIEEEK